MIAVDTGFLFALADRSDAWHGRALACVDTAAQGWVTTWPVLAEACYLLQRNLGTAFSAALMDDVSEGGLRVWSPPDNQLPQIAALLRKYTKLPMDLADASLVLLAEHLGHGQILTTDERDFGAYRWKNHKPFHNLMASPP